MNHVSFNLPDQFQWDNVTGACYAIRRRLDEIWSSAIDLSKGDEAGFALESNVNAINSGVFELLTELYSLEGYIEEIRLAELRSLESHIKEIGLAERRSELKAEVAP